MRQFGKGIVDALANTKNQRDKRLYYDYQDHFRKVGFDQNQIADTIVKNLTSTFENNDPTPNNQYTPWIAREYVKGNIKALEDLARIKVALELYHNYKNKAAFKELFKTAPHVKDIGKLTASQLEDLAHVIDTDLVPQDIAKDKSKGDAELIYDDATVRVIHPKDQAAACYYGQGTRWCTAATRGENYFDRYNEEGPLYIIIPKKPEYPGEKYQLHVYQEQLMNEKDDPVGLDKLYRFPGFLEHLKKLEPTIEKVIHFQDPKIIQGIHKLVSQQIMQWVWEEIHEWEGMDDYWSKYVHDTAIKKGYVDELGDIDYDRVYADPDLNDYASFNNEANELESNGNYLRDMKPADIVNNIDQEEYGPHNGWVTLDNIEDFYKNYSQEKLADNITDLINDRLIITDSEKYKKKYQGISTELGRAGNYVIAVTQRPYRRTR